jgi:hypothetical protein
LADAYRIGIERINACQLRDEQRRHFAFLTSKLATTADKSVEEVCNEMSEDDAATIAMQLKILFEEVENAWVAFCVSQRRTA